MAEGSYNKILWLMIFLFIQVAIVVLFATCYHFPGEVRPKLVEYDHDTDIEQREYSYAIFQDVNVMVFVGFGFLYTYLKDHSLSSVALNLILALFTFEWSTLCQGFFERAFEEKEEGVDRWRKIEFNLGTMIEGDFGAAAVLISYGGVMGKANLPQLFIMAFIESITYSLNYRLGEIYEKFQVTDAGGSMFIHSFGAFFGIACAFVLYRDKGSKIEGNSSNAANKVSNVFAMIGTIFLWMFWPSFNTALIGGAERYRGIINTIFAMIGSCVGTFLTSLIVQKGKFEAEDILNASVSGGVFIGGACNLILVPYAALIVGLVGGAISTLGFEFVGKFLQKNIKLYDTAQILSLHGIPGFLGSIVTTVCVACMSDKEWTYEDATGNIEDRRPDTAGKLLEWKTGKLAGYQFAVELITIGIAVVSGAIAGFIMRFIGDNEKYFVDEEYWVAEQEEGGEGEQKETNNKGNIELANAEQQPITSSKKNLNSEPIKVNSPEV